MANYTSEQRAYIADHANQLGMDPEVFIAAQLNSGLDMPTFAQDRLAAQVNTPAPQSTPSINDILSMIAQQSAQHQQSMMQMQTMITQVLSTMSGPGVQPDPASTAQRPHLANAKLDERCFRRLDKFTNKREDWREWRMHFLTAVKECDTSFAESLKVYEKSETEIEEVSLNPTEQQLSAVLQARLISLTAKEAFSIVVASQGSGCEAWRQLSRRYDPQTDARFASLIINLVGYKIGKSQCVQTALVQWEALLLSLEKDHAETISPKMRRFF